MTFETRLQIPSESLFKGSEDQVLRRFTRSFTVWWWLLKLLCSRQVSPRLGCGRWCWWWPVSNIKVHANYSSKQWSSGRGSQPQQSHHVSQHRPSTTASTAITLHTPYVLLFHGFLILFIGNFLFDLGIKKVLTTS